MQEPVRVTVVVPTFNAGDTTRGVEIARAIQRVADQRGREVEVSFLHPETRQSFVKQIAEAGYETRSTGLALSQEEVDTIMRADHDGTEFLTDQRRSGDVIDAITDDLRQYRPDLMVYGFIPHAGIAAQLMGIPSVVYSPCPVYRPWLEQYFLLDVPDDLRLRIVDRLPKRLRTWLARRLSSLAMRSGFFRQPVLARAARERGWDNPQTDMFGMLDADIQLVNDLPIYYEGQDVGPRTRIAGPLFSKPVDVPVPPEIVHRFAGGGAPKVFVAMGSSGEKEYLLTAIEAVAGVNCRAVVVCPPHVVSLDEARLRLGEIDHVLLTDRFVPAPAVNSLADVAIIHGGQGTVQTAVYAGTPVLGTGMQWEQCSNLDRLVQRGSAIRIPRKNWQVSRVRESLERLIADPAHAVAARELQEELASTDGYQMTGDLIWDLLSEISRGDEPDM